mmetsp:Transcript_73763/g.210344  ORF Transcript_73763/g.210344 Transcript_73763/m.210344 type:complete len:358 (+) Transcript_73763:246-1319(+)
MSCCAPSATWTAWPPSSATTALTSHSTNSPSAYSAAGGTPSPGGSGGSATEAVPDAGGGFVACRCSRAGCLWPRVGANAAPPSAALSSSAPAAPVWPAQRWRQTRSPGRTAALDRRRATASAGSANCGRSLRPCGFLGVRVMRKPAAPRRSSVFVESPPRTQHPTQPIGCSAAGSVGGGAVAAAWVGVSSSAAVVVGGSHSTGAQGRRESSSAPSSTGPSGIQHSIATYGRRCRSTPSSPPREPLPLAPTMATRSWRSVTPNSRSSAQYASSSSSSSSCSKPAERTIRERPTGESVCLAVDASLLSRPSAPGERPHMRGRETDRAALSVVVVTATSTFEATTTRKMRMAQPRVRRLI